MTHSVRTIVPIRISSRCALVLALFAVAHTVRGEPNHSTTNRSRPNVLVFLVDDYGIMDSGCYFPKTFYETRNIDRLAQSGMRFTAGYAACPVCSPTRAAMMTGRAPTRTGITDYIGAAQPDKWNRPTRLLPAPYETKLALGETTLAEVFGQAGYATFFAGKWHLGPEGFWPEDQGFHFNRGGIDRGGPYGGKKYFSPYGNPRLSDGPEGEHLPDRLASETVKFITANKEKPFFAYFSFYSVHTPLMARPDLQAKYQAKANALPAVTPDAEWGQERERKVRLVQNHAVYAGMVEAMDLAVGKVLDTLDSLKLADRTIVVFTSDNGGLSTSEGHPTSNLPYRAGKGWMYEGGIRVPWIVRAPGVTRAGTTNDTPIASADLFPTLVDLCGVETDPKLQLDGRTFQPALKGEPQAQRALYWHYPHYGNQGGAPGSAIREGDWKLIEWLEDGTLELFNLRQDIGEKTNLADREPARRDDLKRKLDAWRKETGAKFPTPRKPKSERGA